MSSSIYKAAREREKAVEDGNFEPWSSDEDDIRVRPSLLTATPAGGRQNLRASATCSRRVFNGSKVHESELTNCWSRVYDYDPSSAVETPPDFTPNAAVLFVDLAIQPEVRFIAKQNSLMKIGNNGNLVLGPFDESTPCLMIVLMNCQTKLRINHLTAVKSVAILESNANLNFYIPG
ncbi:alpha-2 adrenergic receptor [Trichonephila clavipes]|nr:alpha-2 adrenergic receptor [Trichonephila clavipes]